MTQPKQGNTKISILWSYLLFWYLTSTTQLLLAISGAVSLEGIKDTTITAILWLIPVLLFPNQAKKTTGVIGVLIWLLALPGFGYFLVYRQDLTQSLMFIIFESNQSESVEYFQNYLSLSVVVGFIVFTLLPLYLWTKIKPFSIDKSNAYLLSSMAMALVFFSPISRAVSTGNPEAAYKSIDKHLSVGSPWQLILGYKHYEDELKVVEQNLLSFNKIPPLENLVEVKKALPTTVVIVIGESTTRVHMGLYDYQRDTNPKLSSIKNELHVFNNVFASRPNTIESLQQVLTFADQENPDLYKTKPSLLAMMKQAGYKTYWISNQQTLTARNTMLTTFAKQADEQIFLNNARSQNSYSFDEKVLEPYSAKLSQPDQKKLIIVHLIGTHMRYAFRYPASYDYFKDDKGIVAGLSEDKIQTINEYDNAVRYNDHVVYELINRLKQSNQHSLLVYFSDHGDDVYDSKPHNFKGRNEGNPTYPMYAVPFIVWHSKNWERADQFSDQKILNRQYDNADFIYTFSDMVGLRYDGYLDDESLISKNFIDDSIVVGNPYGKSLVLLKGTVNHQDKRHGLHNGFVLGAKN
jgi:heptose-I-phosphate ethanolaminephosphotransferase